MKEKTVGLHHITCIAADVNKNIQFYRDILGLKLVKKTVNFDDPTSYHLYYGDQVGSPGTLITFFIWDSMPQGKKGTGHIDRLSFGIPIDSLPTWLKRLNQLGVKMNKIGTRFGENFVLIEDNEGMEIELVETKNLRVTYQKVENSNVDKDIQIKGIYGVTINEYMEFNRTSYIVKETLGFATKKKERQLIPEESPQNIDIIRYYSTFGSFIEIKLLEKEKFGVIGIGSIHHIAFAVDNEQSQQDISHELREKNVKPTEKIDRSYFWSVYFYTQSTILLELATAEPGFLIDEAQEELGTNLKLPEMYEPHREEIEEHLPSIKV